MAEPPAPRQIPFTETHHGIARHDDYAWLRDPNWQAVMRDPSLLETEIRTHLEAENAHTESVLKPHAKLRAALFAEMKDRVQEDETSLARNLGAIGWLSRYEKGDEHQRICIGDRDCTAETARIIIDGNAEALKLKKAGKDYFKLGAIVPTRNAPTPDKMRVAWSADDTGSEYMRIRIREIASGRDLADILADTSGDMAWSACGEYLFYVALDENHRPNRVMRHRLGTKQAEDSCVYTEADAGFFVALSATRSGRFILISVHDHETSEAWLIATDAPDAAPRCVRPREAGHQYSVDDDASRDRLIILTNSAGAEDFRICSCALDRLTEWEERVAHEAGRLLLAAVPYRDQLAYIWRRDALPTITVMTAEGGTTDIAFAEEAYDLSLDAGLEYDTAILRFDYSSMTTPRQTFDYDMATGARILRKEQCIPSGHNASDYVTRRIYAESHDGARVPISILHHRDTPIDGSAPCLLYGYGAYGITIPSAFSVSRLSLVDRGFVYAIAHVRGGKACGARWFLDGRGARKKNSFEDFAAAARALITQNYTQAKRITMHGGSAGGLLVGATVNLAPELFCGAVAEVPFVDVLATMLDDSLPLTPPEWPEWGNPLASRADYEMIASYAPYDNIAARDYPHILATGGLTDPRVTYWEPAKWIARLRARRTDTGLTLLRTEMTAGHGGKAGRYNQFDETAMIYSFVLMIHEKGE